MLSKQTKELQITLSSIGPLEMSAYLKMNPLSCYVGSIVSWDKCAQLVQLLPIFVFLQI